MKTDALHGCKYDRGEEDIDDKEVMFSHTYKFSECEIKELLPLCNALDFEPYRDRKNS